MNATMRAVRTEADQEELAELAAQIWGEYWPALIGEAQTRYMVEQFQSLGAIRRDMAEHAYEYWFVMDDEGRTCGYTGGHVESETNRFFISKIYLKASERGRHLASDVIAFYVGLCRERGLRAMYLTVNKHNELGIRCYRGKGFDVIDAVETSIGEGFVMDDYIMEKRVPAALADTRLIVMDIDSTLINEEVIDLLGDEAGAGERIAGITERAMRGELDFAQALKERVGLLAGLDEGVFDRAYARVTFTPGARELVAEAHRRGWKVGVVSGGFHEVADRIVAAAGIDYCLANRLEVADEHLTGRLASGIVTKQRKLEALEQWAAELGIPLSQTIAMGDGANDIPMILAAGTGIAFCAKPKVRAAAPHAIDERNLMLAFDIIDSSDRTARNS